MRWRFGFERYKSSSVCRVRPTKLTWSFGRISLQKGGNLYHVRELMQPQSRPSVRQKRFLEVANMIALNAGILTSLCLLIDRLLSRERRSSVCNTFKAKSHTAPEASERDVEYHTVVNAARCQGQFPL